MIIIVTGCTTSPTVIPFEQEPIDLKAEVPLDRCTWPELHEAEISGEAVVYMDKEGLEHQRSCQVTEQTNYDIATNNAGSVDDAVAAFNALIGKAELHNNYAQNELDRVHSELQAEKVQTWTMKGVLLAVLVAIAL